MPTIPTWDELNGIDPQNIICQVFSDEAPMPLNARLPSPLRLIEDESISLTQEMMEAWSPPDPGMHHQVKFFQAGRRNKLRRISRRPEPSKKPIHRRQGDSGIRWSARRGRGG